MIQHVQYLEYLDIIQYLFESWRDNSVWRIVFSDSTFWKIVLKKHLDLFSLRLKQKKHGF